MRRRRSAEKEALLEFAGCAVVITHDRWFLDRVATHILAFEGNSETIWFEGSWGDNVAWMKETRGPRLAPDRQANDDVDDQAAGEDRHE